MSGGRTEEVILHQMVNNSPFFGEFIHFVQPDYFGEQAERMLFEFMVEHSGKYSTQPNTQVLMNMVHNASGVDQSTIDEAKEYITQVLEQPHIPIQSAKWLLDTSETWCRDKALENAIMQSVLVFQNEDTSITREEIPEVIRKALTVSKSTDIGHDYTNNIEERWDLLHKKTEKIPFDIEILNRITKGGLERGTLNCIMAGTGVGKTIFLCHIACNALKQGKNVVYISAEMGEEKIGERIDANLLDIDINELNEMKKSEFLDHWKKHNDMLKVEKQSHGRLLIKQYPTATAHVGHFRAYLEELKLKEGFVPDLILVDYLNICTSARIKVGGGIGTYAYIKSIAEELRGLAVEYDVPIFTATQVNRSGMDTSDISMGDTSESVGLPHTLDLFLALMAPEDLESIDRVIIKQLKNRYNDKNYPAKRFLVGLDKTKMRFYHVDDWAVQDTASQKGDKKGKGNGKGKGQPTNDDVPGMPESYGTLFDASTNGSYSDVNQFSGVDM